MRSRTPFRNNAPAVLAATAAALGLLLGVQALVRKSRDFAPDFLASVVLYGLTVLNISLLLVLVVVLARNIVRVVMERRRKVVGARFRMRLILVFLLMAVAPSAMLISVGSDLIQEAVDRWFSVDVERILSSSNTLASSLRESAAQRSRVHARWLAREIAARELLEAEGQGRLRRTVEARARELEMDAVHVFGLDGELVAVMDPRLPGGGSVGATAEELAQSALRGLEAEAATPFAGGELMRAAVPIVAGEKTVGVVVVSTLVPASVAGEALEVQERYNTFRKAETAKGPIKAMYLSLYIFPALLILFGAVWMALYLARRITTPLRLVADGAERIASGERGLRVEFPAGDDEFDALISSFNRMSERLSRSEEDVEHHRAGLTRKNQELEERRAFIETVLETVGTGVFVVDGDATIRSVNAAAVRLLELPVDAVGRPAAELLVGPGRDAVLQLLERQLTGRGARQERDVVMPERGRDRHLSVTVVPLPDVQGAGGAVAVLDDLTPLIRAQKVAAWGEVARKLAHEIKNPLTPIQLSAQRIRKAYLKGSPEFERILGEGTHAIVGEVEALKNLVDEFAQFARLPAARLVPGSLHDVVEQTLSLYDGLFADVRMERQLDPALPSVRFDAAQMKRVLINLIDNAIEATERRGTVTVFTEFDARHGKVRLGVADDGPGIAPRDRDKLFVPNFSTKKQGSGLGLAIVSRILQEHHGSIRVEDNQPRGARFVAELPA